MWQIVMHKEEMWIVFGPDSGNPTERFNSAGIRLQVFDAGLDDLIKMVTKLNK